MTTVASELDLAGYLDRVRYGGSTDPTLDTLQEGVAAFGTDGRLRLHNTAFARQWRLDFLAWLLPG